MICISVQKNNTMHRTGELTLVIATRTQQRFKTKLSKTKI